MFGYGIVCMSAGSKGNPKSGRNLKILGTAEEEPDEGTGSVYEAAFSPIWYVHFLLLLFCI